MNRFFGRATGYSLLLTSFLFMGAYFRPSNVIGFALLFSFVIAAVIEGYNPTARCLRRWLHANFWI